MKPLDEEIEQTLSSLDDLKPAAPGSDFKAKVMARWEEKSAADVWVRYLKYGIAAMVIMTLANVLTLLTWESVSQPDDFTAEVVEQYLDSSDPFEESYE